MPIDRDRILEKGWRQGSVFSEADSRTELPTVEMSAGCRLILVSHDCDILHPGQREPFVEVCAAEPIERMDGNFRFTKNPRILHIAVQIAGNPTSYSLAGHRRFFLDRARLEQLRPDAEAHLAQNELDSIVRWLAKRYERAALPDTFVERLDPASDAIRQALAEGGERLSGVFLSLDTDTELDAATPYRIEVFGVMPKEHYDVDEYRATCGTAIEAIAAAMAACPGIDIVDHDIYSEDDFTLHDLHFVIEYNCDDLSFDDDVGGPVLPR